MAESDRPTEEVTLARKPFDQWMAELDRRCAARTGLSIRDLADQPFADWYEDGITPAQALRLTLESEGF